MSELVFEPSQTTHWKNLFPSKMMLLGSHNLNESEELIGEISEVGIQQIKDPRTGKNEEVPVIRFANAPPMVLNKTNSRSIAMIYGDRYESWIGCSIQIYAAKIKAFGEEQMALRVREAIPDVGQNIAEHERSLRECTTMQDLQSAFLAIPKHLKPKLVPIKDEMKVTINA